MKMFGLLFVLVVSSPSWAITNTAALSCSSRESLEPIKIVFSADYFQVIENGDSQTARLHGVTLITTSADATGTEKTETGVAKFVSADKKVPVQLKSHFRFKMDNLVNANEFGRFRPVDNCRIQIMIPKDAFAQGRFDAQAVLKCAQSGSEQILSCELGQLF